jgi:hypothetical protein
MNRSRVHCLLLYKKVIMLRTRCIVGSRRLSHNGSIPQLRKQDKTVAQGWETNQLERAKSAIKPLLHCYYNVFVRFRGKNKII